MTNLSGRCSIVFRFNRRFDTVSRSPLRRRRRSLSIIKSLCLAVWLNGCLPAGWAAEGKIGIIGDSMSAGTHSHDTCGRYDMVRCLEERGGAHDRDWSHAGGAQSWSIASRLGFGPGQVVDASDDGEEWKDAFEQAQQVTADGAVNTVFINLGANDVCQNRGHDYSGDLNVIADHIDDTLQLLTDRLPAGSTIFWTGVLDVNRLYDLMRQRDHNLLFESCQATWDLDANKIKEGAAADACDHYFGADACELLSREEEASDLLAELFLTILLESVKVEEGPCGKLLSSKSGVQDRREVREFTRDINQLMADKAKLFDGVNGVKVKYNSRIFDTISGLQPEHVSHLDCYHPSRAGQLYLADNIWRGFNPGTTQVNDLFTEDFSTADYCRQSQANWRSCWVEENDDQAPGSGDVRVGEQRLRVRNRDRSLVRALPLGDYDRAWLAFNWARLDLENLGDYLAAEVSGDGGRTWAEIDRFQGDADDFGLHRGDYYDISPFASADTRIRFHSSSGFGSNDRVVIDNVRVIAWQTASSQDLAPNTSGDDFAWLYGYRERPLLVLNNDGPGADLVDLTPPATGNAYQEGDAIQYTPPRGFNGIDSFSYTAVDSDGRLAERRVGLAVEPNTLEHEFAARIARYPEFEAGFREQLTAQLLAEPDGELAQRFREEVTRMVKEDPWLRRQFIAAFRAAQSEAPVDLYVFVGDDNLQGITENGDFDGAGRSFEQVLKSNTENTVIVMNCAVAGSSAAQWSALDAADGEAAPYLNPPRKTDLATTCLDAVDGIVRSGKGTVRGLVVGLGSSDVLLAGMQGQTALIDYWPRNVHQMIDLFRSRYGDGVRVVMLDTPPPLGSNPSLRESWRALRDQQDEFVSYNFGRVNSDDLETWEDGSILPHFSSLAQSQLGARLADAFVNPEQPVLGSTGGCSAQTPCFPDTGYRIEPSLCETGNFFRREREAGQVLCDQHGDSLHALAAACGGCIDLRAIADGLGVGVVSAVSAPDLLPTFYMPQWLDGQPLHTLPYDDPYTSPPANRCGWQDSEASTFVAAPGQHQYRVETRLAQFCQSDDRSGCGLLLSPQSAVRDSVTINVNISRGGCRTISVGHGG